MGALYQFFDKNIAKGNKFLIFSIVFAIAIRFAYFLKFDLVTIPTLIEGCLWSPIAPLFANPIYSVISSGIALMLIAFITGRINTIHSLIRRKTLLPSSIVILLFSCIPVHMVMSQLYIAVLVVLFVIHILFSGYGATFKQVTAFKAGFYLSFGSLFAPVLLIYFPVLWLCLFKVRCSGLKSFVASVLGFVLIYIPALAYFILTDSIDGFVESFIRIADVEWLALPVLAYSPIKFIALGLFSLLILTILFDNNINSFKDKIRVRNYLSVLTFLAVFSLLCGVLVNLDAALILSIGLAVSAFLIGHFFSLADTKPVVGVFYVLLLMYFIICAFPFY